MCKLTQSWPTCEQLWELEGRAARSVRLVQAARHPPPFLRLGGSRQHPSYHFQPPLTVFSHYNHQSQLIRIFHLRHRHRLQRRPHLHFCRLFSPRAARWRLMWCGKYLQQS